MARTAVVVVVGQQVAGGDGSGSPARGGRVDRGRKGSSRDGAGDQPERDRRRERHGSPPNVENGRLG